MLEVEIVPVFQDNFAYLVICGERKVAAAIDPAEPGPVLERAEQLGVEVVAIWNTHHHFDHTAGNDALVAKLREAGKADGFEVLGPADSKIPGRTRSLASGDVVELGELRATVIATPGHTLDGLCFHIACADGPDAVFTGDALFGAGCGRLFEGDAAMLYRSLNESLGHLADDTRVYFGHEYTVNNLNFAVTVDPDNPALAERLERVKALRAEDKHSAPSTMGEERATNPFLRCGDAKLRATMAERTPAAKLDDDVSVFAAVRELRNDW